MPVSTQGGYLEMATVLSKVIRQTIPHRRRVLNASCTRGCISAYCRCLRSRMPTCHLSVGRWARYSRLPCSSACSSACCWASPSASCCSAFVVVKTKLASLPENVNWIHMLERFHSGWRRLHDGDLRREPRVRPCAVRAPHHGFEGGNPVRLHVRHRGFGVPRAAGARRRSTASPSSRREALIQRTKPLPLKSSVKLTWCSMPLTARLCAKRSRARSARRQATPPRSLSTLQSKAKRTQRQLGAVLSGRVAPLESPDRLIVGNAFYAMLVRRPKRGRDGGGYGDVPAILVLC